MANAYSTLRERRIHGCLVHIDLIDGKIWIQRDGTEEGIAADLERAGIPKEHIVLG
ncbi:MAG: element excision factor XisI family protein [Nostoc sp.]